MCCCTDKAKGVLLCADDELLVGDVMEEAESEAYSVASSKAVAEGLRVLEQGKIYKTEWQGTSFLYVCVYCGITAPKLVVLCKFVCYWLVRLLK